jgi:FkbM family methyltransferase
MALTKEQRRLRKRFIAELNATADVDKDMIKESILNYNIDEIDYQDKICLDLGVNIGAFSKIALDRGAKRVYGLECDLRNYQIASSNFSSEIKVKVVHAAVSGSTEDTLQIYKSNSKSNHSSTSINKRTNTFTEYDRVKNYHITEVLNEVQPDLVKIDIEGAEYDIIEEVARYKPKVLFIEIHGGHEKAKNAVQRFENIYTKSKVDEIIYFNKIGGYDCLFYD